ncbi:CCA tRNA nucleotidyltransferase [Candidatus Paracaedibacter symbiosus]|uniref:CCA tRNA nucleotidyltransferase n=1 Tax=Candidatus Paracaedibacter symbiosus TaxID=244582 RepID=UPI00068FEA3B|nr:CCA tRNA nucleotidyltransferase [Candidatus Paracaedibacter symbiosus]
MAAPPIILELIQKLKPLQRVYSEQGSEIRLVGGCVRDALLGKMAADIDLATPLPPKQGMAALRQKGIVCIPTGIDHGTFTALIDKQPYEITTLRQDITTDGRWAEVAFTNNWQEDAMRRDLTINGLYADFNGTIYDYFNGIADLRDGIVRFIGRAEDRITEDYLRLLRLFRFHAWYGRQPLDTETLAICERLAPKLLTLSKERITKEVLKLLEALNPLLSLTQMAEHKILEVLFQNYNLANLKRLLILEEMVHLPPSPLRRLVVLTKFCLPSSHKDNASRGTKPTLFRFSNAQKTYIHKISTLTQAPLFNTTTYRYYLTVESKEIVQDALIVKYIQEAIENPALLTSIMLDIAATSIPPLPITGTDLIAIGVKAGPEIGNILIHCRHWWAEKGFHPSKEECILWVKQHLKG